MKYFVLVTIFSIISVVKSVYRTIQGEAIFHFPGKINGSDPESSLVKINKTGILYGVTRHGGNSSDDLGVIYRIDTKLNNTFTVVYQFTNATGCQPVSPLVFDGDMFLFGSTIRCSQFNNGNLFRFRISDYYFEVIYEFSSVSNPNSLFLNKVNGLLYGTAGVGSSTYDGSIFTIDIKHEQPSITFKQLFSFDYRTGTYPSNLILFNNSLYVNTEMFGENGAGTLIKMDLDGKNARLIHAFGSHDEFGCAPWGRLVLVMDKQQQQFLYGTTMGAAGCSSTLYRIRLTTTMSDEIELVETFNQTTIGKAPFNGLIQSTNRDLLYGITSEGGINNHGTIFRYNINSNQSIEKVFDLPSGNTFGSEPIGGLLEVGNYSLYGTTSSGGKYNLGTIYQITLS